MPKPFILRYEEMLSTIASAGPKTKSVTAVRAEAQDTDYSSAAGGQALPSLMNRTKTSDHGTEGSDFHRYRYAATEGNGAINSTLTITRIKQESESRDPVKASNQALPR